MRIVKKIKPKVEGFVRKNELQIPYLPENDIPSTPRLAEGEIPFANVDNPGQWHPFVFQPKFTAAKNGKKYVHHALPSGARPCPFDANGERKCSGWKFYYTPFKSSSNTSFQSGATAENMFPESQKGSFDPNVFN